MNTQAPPIMPHARAKFMADMTSNGIDEETATTVINNAEAAYQSAFDAMGTHVMASAAPDMAIITLALALRITMDAADMAGRVLLEGLMASTALHTGGDDTIEGEAA